MLSKEEQLVQLLKNHKSSLLLTKNEISGDLYGSLLAWGFFLGKLNENYYPTLYLPRYEELKKIYNFLPQYPNVIKEIGGIRDFILSFNVIDNDIKNVRWKKDNGHLDIIITPEKGSIDPRDFSFIPAKFRYDLLMVIGTSDFGELGKTYENNSDLFFELPIVNLDNNPGNENFGQLNIVNTLPNSIAELSADLMIRINPDLVKGEVAECLLTAIIEATDNLKNPRVTPKTFEITSYLMENGGNHQQIISALYDTESLASLKLWGKMLERLEESENYVWSFVEKRELEQLEIPDIVMRRFFVRLKNYLELGKRKLVLIWQEKNDESEVFFYKINKEEAGDAAIVEKLGGELFNSDILHFSLKNELGKKNPNILFEEIKTKLKI